MMAKALSLAAALFRRSRERVGGEGSLLDEALRFFDDATEDGDDVVDDFFVSEADDVVAVCLQETGSLGVLFNLFVMDGSVQFDGEADGGTAEVENERADRVLTAELQAGESTSAELHPQQFFSSRHLLPQRPRHWDVVSPPLQWTHFAVSLGMKSVRGDFAVCRLSLHHGAADAKELK